MWIIADPPWHIDAVGGRLHHQSQAKRVIKNWISFYNNERPHTALD
ncbi:integrase core domain-containing protein [Pseudophaeobacter sp. TrK17]